MWFLLGFISIGICVYFEFWRRHLSKWKPEGYEQGLEYRHVTHKSKIRRLYLGARCSQKINFSIKRQSKLDGFFKLIGVSNEFETKDSVFDDSFYLMIDNKALLRSIASSDSFRQAVKNIMAEHPLEGLHAKYIYCRNERVWVDFVVEKNYDSTQLNNFISSLQKSFTDIVALLNLEIHSKTIWTDPFVIKAAILLAISSGLAINGVVQLVRTYFGYTPFVLDNSAIFYDAFQYSLVALIVFLMAALYSLKRSARTHIVLLELATIGFLGLFLSIAMEIRDINMEWDSAEPQIYKVDLVKKHQHNRKGRKKRTLYYVVVKDWRCDCGTYSINVSRGMYHAIMGSQISIIQKPGYLGYPWVTQVIPNPQNY